MNFQTLKGMIESIVKSYKCPECNSSVSDANIDIMGAAGVTINIDVECANCGKHSMIKTEVMSIDLTNKALSSEDIEKLKKTILIKNGKMISSNNPIKDKEIIDLNKDLKKSKLNVTDLLGENK